MTVVRTKRVTAMTVELDLAGGLAGGMFGLVLMGELRERKEIL